MKKTILAIMALLSLNLATPVFAGAAYAACPTTDTPQGQVIDGLQSTGSNCDTGGVDNLLNTIVQILSLVVGVAAIIMIIVAGFKYITSGGDAGKISSAKNTLIYALVGVAVAALAQFLVHFVFTTSTHSTDVKPCASGTHRSADGTCVKN